jgi:hypothetical protein
VPADAVVAALRRVLSSAAFANSGRLSRFLRYAVEQCLQGYVEQLKEYSLRIAVFDKRESFDPRFDPIVRVEAGRLRLRNYYETEGREDAILIDLPKGSYVPRFVSQLVAAPATRGRVGHEASGAARIPSRSCRCCSLLWRERWRDRGIRTGSPFY